MFEREDRPNVLVAGFSRCATTYLYNLLKQHPDIHIPEEKEINYLHKYPLLLSHPALVNPKFFMPKSWYLKKFKSDRKIKIDFSVMTAYDLDSSKRLMNELGDIKIIFITRNKKEHAQSVQKTLENHGEKMKINASYYSDFEKFMAPYKNTFSKVLTISMEDLSDNPEKTINKIWKFMEISREKINLKVYQNPSNNYFEDKHGSKLKFYKFRFKRNALKTVSYLLSSIVGFRKVE